jgi:hypothetical protein
LVAVVALDKGDVYFRTTISALYPQFFKTMLEQLKEKRPGATQVNKVSTDNWLYIAAIKTGFSFNWVLPREGVGGRVLRVELYIDVGYQEPNKQAFESLKKSEKEIESQLGISLNWEKLDAKRASRISAAIPFKLATATLEEIKEAQLWGVDTMLKFIDVFTPFVKGL